jgi:enamine deaminase RidA (YjgF/YER057c/UK114 family)
MSKEIIEVPVLSQAVRDNGVPLSLVTKANGFVFVSGTPPVGLGTGKFVRDDIEAQPKHSSRRFSADLRAQAPRSIRW